jgi:glycosyltransferase XagB
MRPIGGDVITRKDRFADQPSEREANIASGDPLAFLRHDMIAPEVLADAREFARHNEVSVSQVLISRGIISSKDYVTELASYQGLPCLCEQADLENYEIDRIKSGDHHGSEALARDGISKNSGLVSLLRNEQIYVALDVLHYDESTLQLFFSSGQFSRDRLLLITPEIKQQLLQRGAQESRIDEAVNGLANRYKGLSARGKTTFMQKLVVAFFFGLVAEGLVLSPTGTLFVLGGVLNLLFLSVIMLRLYSVMTLVPVASRNEDLKQSAQRVRIGDDELPIYTILVPLFREHRVVGQLINSLLALDYPPHKLDIKLIFEQEDEVTLAAARACNPPVYFEFVVVPKQCPQTKPKALNYALPLARGRYVVVFDAEDRPQPDQLRKAIAAFAQADFPTVEQGADLRPLACLQAGLNHYNIDENWLARQFTIEYTTLFDGLLPALQRLGMPIPLGGTSNHFRTDILREIGGWDAFNVTEDADLGIRLARFGYGCAILHSTTYEEACCRPRDWVRQRTRWMKGWLQTYLVHMRHPVTTFRQLGARGFVGFQVILAAQVLSLMAHPIFIAFMFYEAFGGHLFEAAHSLFGQTFWALALGNFIFGYAVTIWLGYATLGRRGYYRLMWQLPLMPLYWLLISFATFRALFHYVIKPFHWEKTEHGLKSSGEEAIRQVTRRT